jgi:hypothetical protein
MENKGNLLIGVVECFHHLFVDAAWSLIRPAAEELATASMGEYTIYQVYQAIFYGSAHLYLGFIDETNLVKSENAQAFVMDRIVNKNRKGYAGYMLVRMDPSGLFLWQGVIESEFQSGNVLDLAIGYLKKRALDIGAEYIGFTSLSEAWGRKLKEQNFEKTFTTYRANLKK